MVCFGYSIIFLLFLFKYYFASFPPRSSNFAYLFSFSFSFYYLGKSTLSRTLCDISDPLKPVPGDNQASKSTTTDINAYRAPFGQETAILFCSTLKVHPLFFFNFDYFSSSLLKYKTVMTLP